MAKEESTICKTKGCTNPVIDRKYCEHCKQVRKETKNKVLIGVSGVAIPATGYAIIKGKLKQVPKIAKTVLQVILSK